jgi:ABC-type amino acid transport substrate-binding protein
MRDKFAALKVLQRHGLGDVATVKEYKTTDARDLDLKSGRIDAVLDAYPSSSNSFRSDFLAAAGIV